MSGLLQLSVESNKRLRFDWLGKIASLSQQMTETKPKPVVPRSRAFSRALRLLHVFASNPNSFTD